MALGVGAWTLALYALTFLVTRRYYQEHPPHYDSIGLYAALFELVDAARAHGLLAVLPMAFGSGLSWLQPAYALALAWAPIKAPAWLVSLNVVLLLAAQAAILTYGRTFGFSPARQVVAALVPLVPGGFYAWDGGLQDLRRDPQLVLLALAILFLALAYVARPTRWRAVGLGVLVGLAQWSRDNAAAVIVIVTGPAIVLAVARSRASGSLWPLIRLGALPVAVFLLLALPYYAITLPLTVERYQTSVWGVGENRLESLLAFWNTPLSVLFGGDVRLGGGRMRTALATGLLLASAVAAIVVLRRAGLVTVERGRLREPSAVPLLASGAWVVAAVLLYNTLVLGYGAHWHAMPFLPIGVGLIALLVGLTLLVKRAPGSDSRALALALGLGAVSLLFSAPLRMVLNQQSAPGAAEIAALRAAAAEIAARAAGRPVALLAYDTLSRHHVRFYETLAGRPGLTEFEASAQHAGDPIDLDQPLRPTDDPEVLRARLDRALRQHADLVLVYTDTSRYADPRETLWPYLVGQPVVAGLLADPAWRPVARFTVRERELVLLENTAKPAAGRALDRTTRTMLHRRPGGAA